MLGVTDPKEWTELYVRHLLQGSLITQRTRDMYQLVLFHAAQQAKLPDIAAAVVRSAQNERQLSDSLAALVAEFCAGLIGVACDVVDPAPFDARASRGWHQLLSHATRTHLSALTDIVEQAAPRATQEAPPAPNAAHVAARILAFGRVMFDLLGGLTQLGATLEQNFLQAVMATLDGPRANQPVLVLQGSSGHAAVAGLSLQNTLAARTNIRCEVGPVRRADGIGPAFDAAVRLEPRQLSLESQEEFEVRLMLDLDRRCYEPNVLYVGIVSVTQGGDAPLCIPLRITALAPVVRVA
jgi:hypothetical protein